MYAYKRNRNDANVRVHILTVVVYREEEKMTEKKKHKTKINRRRTSNKTVIGI